MFHKVPEGRIAYFDVDHTLVIWELTPREYLKNPDLNSKYLDVRQLLQAQPESLDMEFRGKKFTIRPIWTHVSQLVQQSLKGIRIVVWSAGGADWAEAVVKTLKLEDYVEVILTKPDFFYDDSTPEGFMGKHFFFAWDEINAKMKGKTQKHHDFRKDVKENLSDE